MILCPLLAIAFATAFATACVRGGVDAGQPLVIGATTLAPAADRELGAREMTSRAAPSRRRVARVPGHTGRDSASGVVVTINIPAYRLDVSTGDSTTSYPIAVGSPRFPTPRGRFRLTEIVWNPWWVPPPSDWARGERATPPGPDNPMGRVKLRFTQLVFIHGTPWVESLGSAASHACVRMTNADAIALARLVHRRAVTDVPEAAVDSALADSTLPRRFPVVLPVPVEVRYDLAEVRRDSLWVYPNVYALRAADPRAHAIAALALRGIPAACVEGEMLAVAVRTSRRRPSVVSLSGLVRPECGAPLGR